MKRWGKIIFPVLAVAVLAVFATRYISQSSLGPKPASCVADWRLCKDNEDLLAHYTGIRAVEAACRGEADATVGPLSWVYSAFRLSGKDSDDLETGILHFAAVDTVDRSHPVSHLECSYDLTQGKVIRISRNR